MEAVTKEVTTREVIDRAKSTIEKAERLLKDRGVEYDLGEWITIKKYCERFGIKSESMVTNWIRRGVIPPENIHIVEELNGLRLIKAVLYKEQQ